MANNININGVDVYKVEENHEGILVHATQNKPNKAICPHCGAEVSRMRYTRPRTYKDSPIPFCQDTKISLKRVEGKCTCGKSFTVPCSLIHEGSRMTSYLKSYIDFLLTNPYNMTNGEMADEAGVSEKTIRRAKRGVL